MSETIRMNKDHRYYTSKDYHKLAVLMLTTPVLCMVDYDSHCRDVAGTLYSHHEGSKPTWQLSVRGVSYIYARTVDEFVRQCEKNNVEWVGPTKKATP